MSQKPVLLLIDDEQSVHDALGVLLKDEGFDVVSALTGTDGLDRFQEMKPDIVLSDIRMPKMTGVEVLQEIRERDPSTPVVLLTAQASLQSAIQAVNLGATHYVQKPWVNEELLAVLRRSLDYDDVPGPGRFEAYGFFGVKKANVPGEAVYCRWLIRAWRDKTHRNITFKSRSARKHRWCGSGKVAGDLRT